MLLLITRRLLLNLAMAKTLSFKNLFTLILIIGINWGCDNKVQQPINSSFSVNQIDLSKLNLNSNNVKMLTLNSKQLSLLSEIENNEIQTETLVESLLFTQKKLYLSNFSDPNIIVPTENEILDLIKVFLKGINLTENLNTIKNHFETQLKNNLGELQNDSNLPNLWSVLIEKKIQNHSGTLLFEIIRRFRSENQFKSDNSVVIFSDYEILSGYLKWTTESGYKLYGIKLNGENLNEIEFGPVKKLSGLRIVDSDIFLITEIFKNQITNPLIVFKNGLQLTAEKYNLPLDQMESTIANPLLKLNYENFDSEATLTLNLRLKDPLTQSIFSFGE